MAHWTVLTPLIHEENFEKLSMALLLGAGLFTLGKIYTRRFRNAAAVEAAVIPEKRFSVGGLLDFLVEGFLKFHDSVMGKENRRHAAFTGSIFIFVLCANLIGLVPAIPAATTTVWVNVAMALVVFVYFNYFGVREHGVLGYLRHFAGPPGLPVAIAVFITPLLFPVEIFSTTLRILTLNLRLYWNITADHMVLGIFTTLLRDLHLPAIPGIVTAVIAPFATSVFYILGTFVSCVQAFIFTILTMLYILLATQHEEEH